MDYAKAHNNLGYTYYRQGNYDLAIASYKTALAINPDYAKAHNNLGYTYYQQSNYYYQQSNYEEAIIHYKEFIRLARTSPTLRSLIPEAEHQIQIIEMKSKLFNE